MRFIIALCLLLFVPFCAHAQNAIRDAEIEHHLRVIANPIFQAAGLNPNQIRIIVINDDMVNAFVAGGQNLFLYAGILLETKEVSQLGGVIAHEAGHMAGGHLIRLRANMEQASIESMLATIAGVAVGIGARDGSAGAAAAMGGSEFASRRFLSNSRVFESSADQAGITTLNRLGYSTQGMADFLEHLSGQEALPELQRSGYVLTHPLSRDRLKTVLAATAKSASRNKPWPVAWQDLFLRIQAKLLAFTQPEHALIEFANKNDTPARYGSAIALYRLGKIADALAALAVLEKTEPDNAYFVETRGQILFEQGKIAEAVAAYRRAATMAPNEPLIHLALAQALLQNESAPVDEALQHLQTARDLGERRNPMLQRWMAIAYGRKGQTGLAKLSLAEEAFLQHRYPIATQQANGALKTLASDDVAARQRANDILIQVQQAKK